MTSPAITGVKLFITLNKLLSIDIFLKNSRPLIAGIVINEISLKTECQHL